MEDQPRGTSLKPLPLGFLKPHVAPAKRVAVIRFRDNADVGRAVEMLWSALPRSWAKRGRVEWFLSPIDHDYGDLLSSGVVGARWHC